MVWTKRLAAWGLVWLATGCVTTQLKPPEFSAPSAPGSVGVVLEFKHDPPQKAGAIWNAAEQQRGDLEDEAGDLRPRIIKALEGLLESKGYHVVKTRQEAQYIFAVDPRSMSINYKKGFVMDSAVGRYDIGHVLQDVKTMEEKWKWEFKRDVDETLGISEMMTNIMGTCIGATACGLITAFCACAALSGLLGFVIFYRIPKLKEGLTTHGNGLMESYFKELAAQLPDAGGAAKAPEPAPPAGTPAPAGAAPAAATGSTPPAGEPAKPADGKPAATPK